MKLGVFDSGLGGLFIAKAIRASNPAIDMMYLGDTLHVPYGKRSSDAIYMYTRRAMKFMFENGCQLIVVACNTASATTLRRLQQEWLPEHYPDRNIIGVVVPTLEAAIDGGYKKLGLIGTNFTVHSNVYEEELLKLAPTTRISQVNTPLLVPLIEEGGMDWVSEVLECYLASIKKQGIECLILACTHYGILKSKIQEIMGRDIALLSQDNIIPKKLATYLDRHPEHCNVMSQNSQNTFWVSDYTQTYEKIAHDIYDKNIKIQKANLSHE